MAEDTITPPQTEPTTHDSINLTFSHHGKIRTLSFCKDATITDLCSQIDADLRIPPSNQKLMITPKIGILKHPFPNPSLPLTTLQHKKILLLAPLPSELSSLSHASLNSRPSPRPSHLKPATPSRHHDWRKASDEAAYTFHTILPLAYLPNPSRSHRFLSRLAADPGIKVSMRAHRFSVGVLTEMNPAEHTTHGSRALGLNRNRGEVIELRLRTDAYDGYRDYKVIRKTLCHELAHNVYGEHDRKFWDLTGEIEREVEKGDWTRGGQALTGEEFYNPEDRGVEGEHVDGGGWTGGEFVLGGSGGGGGSSGGNAGSGGSAQGMSRREAMAKAAEERIKKWEAGGGGGASA